MELAEVVGQLVALRRFPVVGFSGETPNEVAVRSDGAVGDRAFEIVEEASGRTLTSRDTPELLAFSARFLEDLVVEDLESWTRVKTPDGREFPLSDAEWLAELSRRLGRPVRWRRVAEGTPERGVLHLMSRPTLRFVERVYGATLEPRFLRANFLIDLSEGKAFEEDEWVGRQIRIGDTLCELLAPSADCLAVTDRLDKPAGDLSMVAGLLKVRGGSLGLRARATKGQRIRVADPVSLVD
ncbi:MAG TPA: MOSC N-terminal beta barrel domain-containing protein [Thermoanaerobaculia bacterium]|jgi:hypothetical protein